MAKKLSVPWRTHSVSREKGVDSRDTPAGFGFRLLGHHLLLFPKLLHCSI